MSDDAPKPASPAADKPPESDPYAAIPVADLSPEEKKRRGALLFRPDLREIIDSVCSAHLKKRGKDAVADAVNRAEDALMNEPVFPVEEAELAPFVNRVAERMAKRVQRRLDLEKVVVRRHHDVERVAARGAVPREDPDLRDRAVREQAMDDALADAKGTRAFDMLYARVVERKSPEEISAQFNVKVATYHALTGRLKTRLRNFVVGLLLPLFAIVGLRAYVMGRDDVARHDHAADAGPHGYSEALARLADAEKACDAADWARCDALLGQAVTADPTILQRDTWQTLRAAADKGLKPAPLPPLPTKVDDSKGPVPNDTKGKAP